MTIFHLTIIVSCILSSFVVCNAQQNICDDEILVVFWNLENFFDYRDDGTGESDREFSSFGGRRWTKKRFLAKCDAVAKSLMWIGDRYGRLPDVIGLAEIENRRVLEKLLSYTLLRKLDYHIVHYDSGDRRGIDVALLYRKSRFEKVSDSRKVPVYAGTRLATRDILHVRLRKTEKPCGDDSLETSAVSGKNEYDFIVNHHPSKFGGERESEGRRSAAMNTLLQMCDSLARKPGKDGFKVPQIAMGDFNDTPDAPPFEIIGNHLVNKGMDLHEKGEGSIRFGGRWDLIDMFLVSADIDSTSMMSICTIPFLVTRDNVHPGDKPLRTYSGPRYIGGVSDHCPIILKIR